MNRSKILLAALCGLLCCMLAAIGLADGQTCYINGQSFPFFFRTYGNGAETSAFHVVVYNAPATLTFRQTEGIANERSVLNWISGKTEWGKYHIYCVLNGCLDKTDDWDSSFNSEEHVLYLNHTGTYDIYVVPFTDKEINDSYTVDHFENWSKVSSWWIAQRTGCYEDLSSPALTSSGIFWAD